MKGANNTYFGSVKEALKTTMLGAKLTVKHLKDAVFKERRDATTADDENYFAKKEGIVTLQYPKEQIPVPDNGRYKLHNEMDDCIVCDKCAKVCPVNCIDIEPIKSTETIGETSDGTPKRLYAAKFDIDMAKCCYCGLCTTVCPTECLTMTKDYDFSTFDVTEMNFGFATLTEEEAQEKRAAYEKAQETKKASASKAVVSTSKKPVLKKAVRPVAKKTTDSGEDSLKRPAFKPKMKIKPVVNKQADSGEAKLSEKVKPVYKPKATPVVKAKKSTEEPIDKTDKPKPKMRPKVRPVAKKTTEPESENKPKYRPKMKARVKPVVKKKSEDNKDNATGKDD